MNESQAREEICRVGRSLFERGYVHATAGNISLRLDDGFLITPTDACLGFLDPARLARLDAQAQQLREMSQREHNPRQREEAQSPGSVFRPRPCCCSRLRLRR